MASKKVLLSAKDLPAQDGQSSEARVDSRQLHMSELIFNIFRVNGALLAAGDRLTAPLGLTSARWQVLGTIANASAPPTMATIAKTIGVSRQNIRLIVRDLERSGTIRLIANPNHARASLVVLTPKGKRSEEALRALQGPFLEHLHGGLDPKHVLAGVELLRALLAKLDHE